MRNVPEGSRICVQTQVGRLGSEHCDPRNHLESFYGGPPNFSSTKLPVLKSAPGRISCKYGAPSHPDATVRKSLANKTIFEYVVFIASFLVSSSQETCVEEIAGFGGGAIVESI